MKRTIEFYAKTQYGARREYIKDANLATYVKFLTGLKTIDGNTRNAISGLVANLTGAEVDFEIEWKEVLP